MPLRPALMPSSYWPHVGGVEQVVEHLASALREAGDLPFVVTNRWPKSMPASETHAHVPIQRRVFRVPEPTARQFIGWALTAASTQRALAKNARQLGCDLVNVHCVSGNGRYGLALHRQLGVPLVVSVHGELTGDANQAYERSRQLRASLRKVLSAAAVVTAPTQDALSQVEAFAGPLGARAVVIPNGVDHQLFSSGAQGQRSQEVLGVGRLVVNKRFDVLLRAFDEVAASSPNLRLSIIGDGPERGPLRALAASLPHRDRITFLGSLGSQAVAAHLGRAALFVLASEQEAMGLTVLEAMSAGAAVVATSVGGIPEVVTNNANGLLVPAGDVVATASAMRSLLEDDSLRRRLVATAATDVLGYGWDRCTAEFRSLFAILTRST